MELIDEFSKMQDYPEFMTMAEVTAHIGGLDPDTPFALNMYMSFNQKYLTLDEVAIIETRIKALTFQENAINKRNLAYLTRHDPPLLIRQNAQNFEFE